MPDLSRLTARQRTQLLAADEANLERIAEAYALMYDRLNGNIDALMQAIEAMDEPSVAEIKRLPQYKELMRRSKIELDRFEIFAETIIEAAAFAAIGLGLAHSAAMLKQVGIDNFQSLQPSAMRALLDFLDPEGPLFARLAQLTGYTVGQVVDKIIEGVGEGWNPRRIASAIQDAFGGGLTDALRNTRTVQLWSYRESARANYLSTNGIVTGWIWFAELDADTCAACVAEHGTIHDLDEQLDGHYNCRCAPIPYIDDLAADVPELTIIMAHPAFPWVDEQLAVLVHKGNVFMDISGWSPKYFRPLLIQYANTLIQDKVMFGSDHPIMTPDRWLADFAEAPFRDEVREKILWKNANRILGLWF